MLFWLKITFLPVSVSAGCFSLSNVTFLPGSVSALLLYVRRYIPSQVCHCFCVWVQLLFCVKHQRLKFWTLNFDEYGMGDELLWKLNHGFSFKKKCFCLKYFIHPQIVCLEKKFYFFFNFCFYIAHASKLILFLGPSFGFCLSACLLVSLLADWAFIVQGMLAAAYFDCFIFTVSLFQSQPQWSTTWCHRCSTLPILRRVFHQRVSCHTTAHCSLRWGLQGPRSNSCVPPRRPSSLSPTRRVVCSSPMIPLLKG